MRRCRRSRACIDRQVKRICQNVTRSDNSAKFEFFWTAVAEKAQGRGKERIQDLTGVLAYLNDVSLLVTEFSWKNGQLCLFLQLYNF